MKHRLFTRLIAIAVAVLFAGCGTPTDALHAVRERGILRGKNQDGFTVIHLRGTWFEMGRQYGSAMEEPMRRVLAFAQKRASETSDRYLLPRGIPCGIAFLDRFFEGVAAGSGLSMAELLT